MEIKKQRYLEKFLSLNHLGCPNLYIQSPILMYQQHALLSLVKHDLAFYGITKEIESIPTY